MSIIKRATCDPNVMVVSSFVYGCNNCDFKDIVSVSMDDEPCCPKCNAKLRLVSSHSSAKESDESSESYDDSSSFSSE